MRNSVWNIRMSEFARNTHNPIRAIVDQMNIIPNPRKSMIALSIGDPTIFGNLQPAQEALNEMRKVIDERRFNGYGLSIGHAEAREAVAEYCAHQGVIKKITAKDVILCSGCSGALELCISVIANDGQNILVPKPGFSIYHTQASNRIECRSYNLLPHQNWEIDLKHLEEVIDDKTAAIIVTNPSNPCGSVFSKQHILEILQVAERNFLPIIADEIYEHMVFPGCEYNSFASLSKNVPILSCGGTTKRFLVPGWRMGWIIIHDRHGAFDEVRRGLLNLSVRILGPNTLVQGALPNILRHTPQWFHAEVMRTLQHHADVAFSMLAKVPGLKPIRPSAAMYMMIGIDMPSFPNIRDDLDFVDKLVSEQSVFCLAGRCFGIENFIRIVLTAPTEMIVEACERMKEFCEKQFESNTSEKHEDNLAVKLAIIEKI